MQVKIKESYNHIGMDTGEQGRNNKTHMEKIYTVYDCYGEIGVYKTREEAQEVIDTWYNDPELYPDGDPQLRIEEDVIEVMNQKIIVPDDLSETEGTQVTDIAKKEDYPQFKKGKSITNQIIKENISDITESETDNSQADEIVNKFNSSSHTLNDLLKYMNEINDLEYNNKISNEKYKEANHSLLDIYLEARNKEER